MKSSFQAVLGLIVIGAGVYWYLGAAENVPTNAVKVSIMNRDHVSGTEGITYNSNPPTSGPHFSEWENEWKFYDTELAMGGLVHNMEHGGIVVFYKSSLDEATKAALKQFTENNFKTIASVNEDLPSPIALASWGYYELFDTFDEERMQAFYKKHLNNAPENVYP